MAAVNGRYVPVSSLTLEQAQEALCDAYDIIGAIDEKTDELMALIVEWRHA